MTGFWGDWRGDYHYLAPALAFEKAAGIDGVGRRYKMPPDHDLESLEHEIKRRVKWADIAMDERLRRAHEYADALAALNPELQAIRYDRDDLLQTWHFLLGATSGLNPADIDYFINRGRDEKLQDAYAEKLEKTLTRQFNRAAADAVQWRPCEETYHLILRKLAEKRGGPAFKPN